MTSKLTIFNFINSYTALAYAIFIPHRWVVNGTCDKDKRGCFEELSNQLMATFIIHDGRKLTEVPDRTSTDMIEGTY